MRTTTTRARRGRIAAAFGAALTAIAAAAITAAAPPAAAAAATPTPDSFWGDTGSIPQAHNVLTVKILNRTRGQYPDSKVFWTFNGKTHSIADQQYLDMPVSNGRMYFHLGSPNSRYVDFIEFVVSADTFNGNTTRVDGFGLKIAMRLHAHDGFDTRVGDAYELFTEDRKATFDRFRNAVPMPFKNLADVQAPYAIPAPGKAPGFLPGGAHAHYFDDYAHSVGVNESTVHILTCDGSLKNNANLCAALNRHTAQLPANQQQKPENFYKKAPANYYAQFWHQHSIGNRAYGFPYDDAASQSSFVSHANPKYLEVAIGW